MLRPSLIIIKGDMLLAADAIFDHRVLAPLATEALPDNCLPVFQTRLLVPVPHFVRGYLAVADDWLLHTVLKSWVRTSQGTHHVSIPTPNQLTRFREIIAVYYENHTHLGSWAVLEEPTIVQPLKNFSASYGTRRFNTVFTRALH
jgi:hypothetical protein